MNDRKRGRFPGVPLALGLQIDYTTLDEAWRKGGGEGGRAGGAEVIRLVADKDGEPWTAPADGVNRYVAAVEVWHGLRGGINDEAMEKIRAGQLTFDQARVEGFAQVQEVTISPWLFVRRRDGRVLVEYKLGWQAAGEVLARRRIPGFDDNHHLQPSQSFRPNKTTMFRPGLWPIPPGAFLGAMARTSQKREGADVQVTIYVGEETP